MIGFAIGCDFFVAGYCETAETVISLSSLSVRIDFFRSLFLSFHRGVKCVNLFVSIELCNR